MYVYIYIYIFYTVTVFGINMAYTCAGICFRGLNLPRMTWPTRISKPGMSPGGLEGSCWEITLPKLLSLGIQQPANR